MKYATLLILAIYCLFVYSCKKKKDAAPASRLPASFTGMKTWRRATDPTSPTRYQFAVTTQGKDTVTIEGRGLYYQSTVTTNTGYILKYRSSLPMAGYSSATFIHTTNGDTIYYGWEHSDLGGHTVIASYVTP